MDLPTYTSIWRIEKRLYKLYDFRLPMPLPIGQVTVFAAVAVPYVLILQLIGLPFNHTLIWLYILPPGVATWLATRPVLESKRLPELIKSQVRYLAEPKVICRLAPQTERDVVLVTGRIWRPRTRRAGSTSAAEVLVTEMPDHGMPDHGMPDHGMPDHGMPDHGMPGQEALEAGAVDARRTAGAPAPEPSTEPGPPGAAAGHPAITPDRLTGPPRAAGRSRAGRPAWPISGWGSVSAGAAATGAGADCGAGSPGETGPGQQSRSGSQARPRYGAAAVQPAVPAGLAMPARPQPVAVPDSGDVGSSAVGAWPVAPAAPAAGPAAEQAARPAEPGSPAEPGHPAATAAAGQAPGPSPVPGTRASSPDTGMEPRTGTPGTTAAEAAISAGAATSAGLGASAGAGAPAARRPQVTVVNSGLAGNAPLTVERALAGPSARRGDMRAGQRVAVVPGGHRPGKPDLLQRDRSRVQRPLGGPARVVMLGCTVGAGQTMTALITGDVLAGLRSDRIAVLDLNPGAGSLTARAEARPALGQAALLSPSRLAVIAPPRPGANGSLGAAGSGSRADAELAFQAATDRFELVLADPATVVVPALLGLADQLVLVAPASGAAPGAVAMTFEWLEAHGQARLSAGAIMVLNGVSRRSVAHVEQAERVCAGRCRATVRVPWDDQLQERPPQQMPAAGTGPHGRRHWAGVLSPATTGAFTALAGVLVASLADRADREGARAALVGAHPGQAPAELGKGGR